MSTKEPDVPEPRTLLTDLILGESPRWYDDRLWFSDWTRSRMAASVKVV